LSSLDYYNRAAPSDQAILDIFDGEWSSAMPSHSGLTTRPGSAPLFEDPRVTWVETALGGFRDRSILELGPLEAGHSYMLQQAGARRVVAVEANSRALLKCLAVQKILRLDRVEFLFGEFNEYLENSSETFDVVFASGVLYHTVNPIRTLELIAAAAPRVFLWTHYYDRKLIEDRGLQHQFEQVSVTDFRGLSVTLAKRLYGQALEWKGFCGGGVDYANWLDRPSLMALLGLVGYSQLSVAFDQPDHPNGPAIAICAEQR